MFGPKLEPRSYTTLLLVVVGSLLTLNLMAQYGSRDSDEADYSDAGASREVAAATSQVAAATERVAESNQAIADAIRDLAKAVQDLDFPTSESAGTGGENAPDDIDPSTQFEYEGSFELN